MNPTLDLFSVSSDMLSLHLGSFLCVTCSECSSVVLAPGARLFGRRGFSLHLSKLGMSSGWRRGRGLPPALPSNLPQEGQAVSPLFLSRWQGLGRGRAQLPAVLRVSPVSPTAHTTQAGDLDCCVLIHECQPLLLFLSHSITFLEKEDTLHSPLYPAAWPGVATGRCWFPTVLRGWALSCPSPS